MSAKIKYSINKSTGVPVYINDASNGLSCNCKCCKCGMDFEACQGEKNDWYFRHSVECICDGGQETVIHKLAKKIIVENTQLILPWGTLIYSNPRIQKQIGSVIPDVIISENEIDIYVEIKVTHGVDHIKKTFYKNGKLKSFEIDLSKIPYDTSPKEIEDLVLIKNSNKKKIYWDDDLSKNTISIKQLFWGLIIFLSIVLVPKIIKMFTKKYPQRKSRYNTTKQKNKNFHKR